MCRIRLLLVEMGIWLAAFSGGDGSDGTGDGGDGEGNRTASRHMVGNVLYIVKNFHFNFGDVVYSPSVDKDGYPAGYAHWWGWR
jgi:hypothetical protein